LKQATLAESAELREESARFGLEFESVDTTTRALLLRQLYLAHMERREFQEALEVGQQMAALDVLPDVARQDVARAYLGLGNPNAAVSELRVASRIAPAQRRSFHLWTLGSALYLLGRNDEAIQALRRAVRWSTSARPLYVAQMALARVARGEAVPGLAEIADELEEAPCGRGYGQFVLGALAVHLGRHEAARGHLSRFVERSSSGRVALAVGLSAELARAREVLENLSVSPE
jgi:tetratricopeptide (TPR) repeat protein